MFAVMFALMMVSTAALAAEPLAYRDGKQVSAVYGRTVLDTTMGMLEGTDAGAQLSVTDKEEGTAVHLTVTRAEPKGAYEDFSNVVGGKVHMLTLEASKRISTLDNGIKVGVLAKYRHQFGKTNGGERGIYPNFDNNGNYIGDTNWQDRSEVNLQIIEAGVLVQKDMDNLHVYAGALLQVIKGKFEYSYADSDGYSYSEKTDLTAKDGFGATAGIAYDITKRVTLKANATFMSHTSAMAAVGYNFQ